MSRFPDPISLPESVFELRRERLRELLRCSWQGVSIRFMIVIFELAGVRYFGSSALLLDAVSSLVDIGSSLLLILCIKLADKPPDEDHPFGHGRYEPLIGLFLGLFMMCLGIGLGVQQGFHLVYPSHQMQVDPRAWVIPAVAVVLLEMSYQVVLRVARRQHSPALAAEAIHYRIDSITSLFAMVALIFAAFIPAWSVQMDHIGAILISGLMFVVGLNAFNNNLHQIMDRVPEEKYFIRVKNSAIKVSGVLGIEKVRIQQYGPDAHVDIDIEVDPKLPVEEAHAISQQVRVEIQKEWPAVRDVTVHIEPYYPGDH